MENCLNCNEKVKGREGKKFCTPYCRSNYHYQKNKSKEKNLFVSIDKQLKLNRRLLQHFNRSGKSVVRKETLLDKGFNPKYFTHYWKNQKGAVYLFCYEFGFLEKQDNNRSKYVLVQWQNYMSS